MINFVKSLTEVKIDHVMGRFTIEFVCNVIRDVEQSVRSKRPCRVSMSDVRAECPCRMSVSGVRVG